MLCHLRSRDPQEVTAQPGSPWWTEQQGQMEQAPSWWHEAGIPSQPTVGPVRTKPVVLLGMKRHESTCWETPLQLGTPGRA